jgi:hypothetical protein
VFHDEGHEEADADVGDEDDVDEPLQGVVDLAGKNE